MKVGNNEMDPKVITNQKLLGREKVAFSLTETGLLIISLTLSTQLMFFMTDIVGISAAIVGVMLLVARVWDAANDIIMGVIVEKTDSRFGRFRPYILFGGIILGLSLVVNFTKFDLSDGWKVVYMYAAYILFGMAYTVVFIPYTTMMNNIANDEKERTVLSSMKGGFQAFGVLIASVLTVPLVKHFGGGELSAEGFQTTTLIYAVFVIILFAITFFGVKEKPIAASEKKDRITFKMFKEIVLTNKPLLMIIIVYFLIYFRVFLNNGSAMYFFVYRLNRSDLIPVFMAIFSGINVIVALFAPKLSGKFGKKKIVILGMIICLLAYAGMYIFRLTSIPLFLMFTVLMGLSGGIPYLLIWAFVADVANHTAKKTGYRADAIIYAATSFTNKLSAGLAGAFSGLVLAYYGYVANQAQTPQALFGIDLLMFIVPAISMIAVVIPLLFYKIKEG